MRVLQVIDSLHTGGAEKMIILLCNLLHKNNVEVELLLLVEEGALLNELNSNITVHNLERTNRFDFQKMKTVAALVSNFDIVHIHLKHNYRYVLFCCKLFGYKKAKFILHDHSHNLLVKKRTVRAIKDWFFKNVLKPEYYIGVHVDNLAWADKTLKVKKNKCFLLENVIEKKQVKSHENNPSGVVMVGNITRIKNIEFALKLIKQEQENLTIYGNKVDKTYFMELELKIKHLNISNSVTFVHNCTNVQPHLHKYKYALHTSKKETGPLVLLEYLAQGLPFVSYATGQVYETLKDKMPFVFCNTFNESDWLPKIDNLHLVDKQKMQDCYTNNFSTVNYLKKCLEIYKNTLHS